MKVKRIIHRAYRELLEARKKGHNIPQIVGKYHYLFSNQRGEISLMKHLRGYNKHPNFWEIYCLEGGLFKGTESYRTKKEAVKNIKEYLGVDDFTELVGKKLDKIKNERHTRNKRRNT